MERGGTLRVSAPVTLGLTLLAPLLARFSRSFTDVVVDLSLADDRVDLVSGKFDVALRVAPALEDSSMAALRITSGALWLVAGRGHLAARRDPKTPEELALHDAIVVGSSRRAAWHLTDGVRRVTVAVVPKVVTNSMLFAAEAAASDRGIAFVPAHVCARAVAADRLVRVLPAWRSPPTTVWAVQPVRRHAAPWARAFVEILERELAALTAL